MTDMCPFALALFCEAAIEIEALERKCQTIELLTGQPERRII
jgi:hypothetical protein